MKLGRFPTHRGFVSSMTLLSGFFMFLSLIIAEPAPHLHGWVAYLWFYLLLAVICFVGGLIGAELLWRALSCMYGVRRGQTPDKGPGTRETADRSEPPQVKK